MANPNPKTKHLEPYQWPPGKSGNPKGGEPGRKHLSTWIQEMLHQEIDFKVLTEQNGKKKVFQTYKGVPIQAIIAVAIHQSMLGNKDAREWLAKHGYGVKVSLNGEDPVETTLRELGLLDDEEQESGEEKNAGQTTGTKKKTS